MYIIEDGRIDEDKEYRYFKCPKCGCEFVAVKTEWQYDLDKYDSIFCDCPTKGCETVIYMDFRFNPKIDYNPAEDYI